MRRVVRKKPQGRRQPPQPPKRIRPPCRIKGCKKPSAYQRTIKDKVEVYCAAHWKQHIESDVAFMNAVKNHPGPTLRRVGVQPKKKRKVVRRANRG